MFILTDAEGTTISRHTSKKTVIANVVEAMMISHTVADLTFKIARGNIDVLVNGAKTNSIREDSILLRQARIIQFQGTPGNGGWYKCDHELYKNLPGVPENLHPLGNHSGYMYFDADDAYLGYQQLTVKDFADAGLNHVKHTCEELARFNTDKLMKAPPGAAVVLLVAGLSKHYLTIAKKKL